MNTDFYLALPHSAPGDLASAISREKWAAVVDAHPELQPESIELDALSAVHLGSGMRLRHESGQILATNCGPAAMEVLHHLALALEAKVYTRRGDEVVAEAPNPAKPPPSATGSKPASAGPGWKRGLDFAVALSCTLPLLGVLVYLHEVSLHVYSVFDILSPGRVAFLIAFPGLLAGAGLLFFLKRQESLLLLVPYWILLVGQSIVLQRILPAFSLALLSVLACIICRRIGSGEFRGPWLRAATDGSIPSGGIVPPLPPVLSMARNVDLVQWFSVVAGTFGLVNSLALAYLETRPNQAAGPSDPPFFLVVSIATAALVFAGTLGPFLGRPRAKALLVPAAAMALGVWLQLRSDQALIYLGWTILINALLWGNAWLFPTRKNPTLKTSDSSAKDPMDTLGGS